MPFVALSERHYAHICNEAYLAGAFDLEGHVLSQTATFLREFVAEHTDTIPTEGAQVCRALSELSATGDALGLGTAHLAEVCEDIYKKVQALKEDEFVLLPGGWRGSPGHAMIYEFKRNKAGGFDFKIYNSGAGLYSHESYKGKFDPVRNYVVPGTELEKPDFAMQFKRVMRKLMEVSHPVSDIDQQVLGADELYDVVFAQLAYIGAELQSAGAVPAVEQREKHIIPQLAGTCSQNALHEMLKGHFADMDAYKRFMYRFKAYALERYIATLKESGQFSHAQKKYLLIKGIKSNLRLLNRLTKSGDYLFDDAFKSLELLRLAGYLAELSAVKKHSTLTTPPADATLAVLPTVDYTFARISRPLPKASEDIAAPPASAPLAPVGMTVISEHTEDILSALDKIYSELTQLSETGQCKEAINRLESLFFTQLQLPTKLNAPLKVPFQGLNTDAIAQAFFKKISNLETLATDLYAKHKTDLGLGRAVYSRYDTAPPPNVMAQHIRLNCMALEAHVFTALPGYQKQPERYEPLLKQMLACFPSETSMLHDYSMASNKPLVDARYVELCTLVHSLDSSTSTVKADDLYELEILKKLVDDSSPKFVADAEQDFERRRLYEVEQYQFDKLRGIFDGDNPNPESLHIFLKKHRLHTVYGLLKNYRGYISRDDTKFYHELESIKAFKSSFAGANVSDLWPYKYSNHTLSDGLRPILRQAKARAKVLRLRYDQIESYIKDDLSGTLSLDCSVRVKKPDLLCDIKAVDGEINLDSIVMHGPADKIRQELLLLRTVLPLQIPLTIDYFAKHLSHLAIKDMKAYFEANLFQPGLLRTQLLEHPDVFFEQFEKFIDSGLRMYKERNKPTKDSLFFVRMSFLVYQYAARLDRKHQGKLVNLYEKINGLIKQCTAPSITSTLLKYQMLTANEIKVYAPEKTLGFIQDDLRALFSFPLNPGQEDELDQESKYQFKLAQQNVRDTLAKMSDKQTIAILKEFAKAQGFNLGESPITGTYPLFTVAILDQTLQFDFRDAVIYHNGNARTVMQYYEHQMPLLRKFGLDKEQFCFLKQSTSSWYFDDDKTVLLKHGSLEMQLVGHQRYLIRGLDGLDPDKWYEIFATNDLDAGAFTLSKISESVIKLSSTVADHGTFLLMECDSDTPKVALVKDAKVVMTGERSPTDPLLLQITECATKRVLCQHQPSQLTNPFTAFEPEQFIDVFYDEATDIYHVELARYGLSFSKEPGSDLTCVYNGERYYLKPSESTMIEEGIPQLELRNEKGEEIVVFPISQFLLDPGRRSRNSAYKHFVLNVDGSIEKQIIAGTDPLSWKAIESRKSYMIKITDGEPTPENSEQALYLAYLFLGAHQPEKAWQMLELCDKKFGGITGSFTEVEYLQWIVTSLPFLKQEENKEDKPKVIPNPIESTPEVVACQLKALSFLARLDREKIPKGTKFDPPKTDNEKVATYSSRVVAEFVKESGQHIVKLYERQLDFSAAHEELAQFALTKEDQWVLLDYCKMTQPSLPPRVALEYQTFYIQVLTQELEHLQKIKPTAAAITKKIELIQGLIAKMKAVVFTTVLVGNQDVRCELLKDSPVTSKLTEAVSPLIFSKPYDMSIPSRDRVLAELNEDISSFQFVKNLSHYVAIAEDKKNPDFDKLKTYCERVLISYAKAKDLRSISNIFLLANILYRICQNDRKDFLTKAKENYMRNMALWDSEARKSEYGFGTSFERKAEYERDKRADEDKQKIEALLAAANDLSYGAITIKTPLPSSNVFISAREIQSTLPARKPDRNPVPLLPASSAAASFQHWFTENHGALKEQLNAAQAALLPSPDTAIEDPTPFFNTDEYKVGKKRLNELKALRSVSCMLFSESENAAITRNITTYKDALSIKVTDLQDEILRLAKSKLPTSRLVDIASDAALGLDINRLLTLYFQNDLNEYRTATLLEIAEIQRLHALLIEYVEHTTAMQQAARSMKLLESIAAAEGETKEVLNLQLAQTMLATNTLDAAKDTELCAFQLHSDILLRDNQVSTLEKLLTQTAEKRFTETIEKVIMGGGKSKVILPTLAQKKADGHSLVIVEVPRALLQTCYADLRSTSRTLFNQEAFIFDFNRNSDCSPEALNRLHMRFLLAIQNKSYMVTTGESLQSLELKYFELLKNPPSAYAAKQSWNEAVHTLDQLIKLLRERGALIIDEAHDGLLLKNKLNYTVGEPIALRPEIVDASVALYELMVTQNFSLSGIAESVPFAEILLGKHALSPAQYDELCQQIAALMMVSKHSPIRVLIAKYTEGKTAADRDSFITELKQYLLNKSTTEPAFLNKALAIDKEIFAFCKAELATFLPATLSRKHWVNYGESLDATTPAEERAVALPYRSNMTPKYGSHFGNEIESINYTIQSMLLTGIERELFVKLLLNWREKSRADMLLYSIEEDKTETGALFKSISGESFAMIDVLSPATQELLYQRLKRDQTVIFSALKTMVLGKIKIDQEILHADAYSHVDIVHSCQGITGTPWNSSTFHQRLRYDNKIALGTDGYVVSAIQEKKPQFIGLDFDNTRQFVDQLLEKSSGRARAIIDVSATFKGIDNHLVATEVAAYLADHMSKFATKKPKIKYVLYFNAADQLAAMPVDATERTLGPVVIGSSDPKLIQQKLRSTPEELFSFYDQSHTIGADIKQEDDAKAVILVDKGTHLQSFLQGAMRMRGLIERDQAVDMVMPVKMQTVLMASPDTAYVQFIEQISDNEKKQLKEDNFHAAIAKIYNSVRNDFCLRILAFEPDQQDKKSHVFQSLESFFIEIKESDLYPRFGQIAKEQDTAKILSEVCQRTLARWEALLQRAGYSILSEDRTWMEKKFEAIVSNMGESNPKQLTSSGVELDVSAETMKQQQTEQQMLVQVETAQMAETSSVSASKTCNTYQTLLGAPSLRMFSSAPLSLNKMCRTSFFDDNITVSNNFSQSYNEQRDPLDRYLKPVHALYFTRREGKLYCQLLTQQESKELLEKKAVDETGRSWLTSTSHTMLAGKPPTDFKSDEQYQRLLTQARYFNGELGQILAENKVVGCEWLKEEAAEKIDFFKRKLLPRRETTASEMGMLGLFYASYTDAVKRVIANPDITLEELKLAFPLFSEKDHDSLVEGAKRFNDLIKAWEKSSFATTCEQQKNKFGSYSADFKKYLDHLILLKNSSDGLNKQAKTKAVKPLHESMLILSSISINLLTTLQRQANLDLNAPKHYVLLYAMAMNPGLSNPELALVVEKSKKNLALRYALLLNVALADKITPQRLGDFLASPNHTQMTLLAMASYPSLRNEHTEALLRHADDIHLSSADRNALLCRLIINPSIAPECISRVIAAETKLYTPVARALVARNDINDPKIFYRLLTGTKKFVAKLTIELLSRLSTSATDQEQFTLILQHSSFNSTIYPLLIRNPNCTNEAITQLLQRRDVNGEHLVAILDNKSIPLSNAAKREIAKQLIEKTEHCRFSHADRLMSDTVKQMKEREAAAGDDVLDRLCIDFRTIYQQANSPDMQFLRSIITRLRGVTVIGGYAKAKKIEAAIMSLPIPARTEVTLTDNPVIQALLQSRFTNYYTYAKSYQDFSKFKQNYGTIVDKPETTSLITRMENYKASLEKRKGAYWQDKSNALGYAIAALGARQSFDAIHLETLYPSYAKATVSSKVNALINEAIEIIHQLNKPGI